MTLDGARRVVEITVEQARGRVPVVAGAGSNDTAKAIELSRVMQRGRGDAPAARVADVQQAAAARHRRALHGDRRRRRPADRASTTCPGAPASNIEAATTLELARHPRHHRGEGGVGEPRADQRLHRRPPGRTSACFRATTSSRSPMLALGGDGLISVVSNAVPRLMTALVRLARAGDVAAAREHPHAAAAVDARRVHRVESHSRQGGARDDGEDARTCCALPLVPLADGARRRRCAPRSRRRGRSRDGVARIARWTRVRRATCSRCADTPAGTRAAGRGASRWSTRCSARWSAARCARRSATPTARGTPCRG